MKRTNRKTVSLSLSNDLLFTSFLSSALAAFYLWICRLRLLAASLSCWGGRALRQMVMMGLAKMKQTIHMEMTHWAWV